MNELGTYLFRNHYQICRHLKQNTSEISRVRACICVHLSVCMHVYVCICVVNVCMHVCTWVWMNTWEYVSAYTCTYPYTHICGNQRSSSNCSSGANHLFYEARSLIGIWSLLIRLDCLTCVCTRTRLCIHTQTQHPLASAHQCWGYKYLSPH